MYTFINVSLSLARTLSLSRALSLSLARSCARSLPLSLSHSLALSLSLSLARSLSLSFSCSLALLLSTSASSRTHTHTYTHIHIHTHTNTHTAERARVQHTRHLRDRGRDARGQAARLTHPQLLGTLPAGVCVSGMRQHCCVFFVCVVIVCSYVCISSFLYETFRVSGDSIVVLLWCCFCVFLCVYLFICV